MHRSRWKMFHLAVFCLMAWLPACGGEGPMPPPDGPDPPPDPDPGVTTTCAPPASSGWIWTDVSVGTKPVVALDDAGTPHVAFMQEAQAGWIRLSAIDPSSGAAGQPFTVATGYFYGPFDMDAKGGRIHIGYHDHNREDLVLARRDTDGTWGSFTQANAGHDGWHGAIKRATAGGVHIASIDPSGFGGVGVFYSFFENGNFDLELAMPGSFMYDGGLSLDVAADGTVYAAVFDDTAGITYLARRNGPNSWGVQQLEALGSWLETGRFPQVRVGPDGTTLHVVFLSRTSQTEGVIRYGSGTFGSLTFRDVSQVSDISIDRGLGARNMVDIDFMDDGTPVVAFQTTAETGVAWGTASGFDVRERIAAADDIMLRQQVSLVVNNDVVHLAFWQGDLPGQVCYARK